MRALDIHEAIMPGFRGSVNHVVGLSLRATPSPIFYLPVFFFVTRAKGAADLVRKRYINVSPVFLSPDGTENPITSKISGNSYTMCVQEPLVQSHTHASLIYGRQRSPQEPHNQSVGCDSIGRLFGCDACEPIFSSRSRCQTQRKQGKTIQQTNTRKNGTNRQQAEQQPQHTE